MLIIFHLRWVNQYKKLYKHMYILCHLSVKKIRSMNVYEFEFEVSLDFNCNDLKIYLYRVFIYTTIWELLLNNVLIHYIKYKFPIQTPKWGRYISWISVTELLYLVLTNKLKQENLLIKQTNIHIHTFMWACRIL